MRIYDFSKADLDYPSGYNIFIRQHQKSSYFHTSAYINSIRKCSQIDPVAIAVIDDKNQLTGIAIGELTSELTYLPFLTKRVIFYAPPLFSDIEALKLILQYIDKLKVGLFAQIRCFYKLSPSELEIYDKHGFEFSSHLNAYIPIEEESLILKKFEKDKRKGIKKAVNKYKLIIEEFDDTTLAVKNFYQIQKKLYRKKRHALRSKDYFYNLVKESQGAVRIAFAMYNNQPIATQLYSFFGNRITTLYTSTLPEHSNKYAGDLLIWYLIKKSIAHNLMFLDFGGGGNPNHPYPPRDYKRRFGCIFENVGRYTLPKHFLYRFAMFIYNLILKK